MDFYSISKVFPKRKDGSIKISPEFKVCHSEDLMTRGGKFYAIWDEASGLWNKDELFVQQIVDQDLNKERSKIQSEEDISVAYMSNFNSKSWSQFQRYVADIPDNFHQLDNKLMFQNTEVKKTDYSSKKLPYSLIEGSYDAFDEIIGTLYDPVERRKIEWAIGSIVAGESKDIQKFVVLYGDAGAGKSTILNIIQKLFQGYYTVFEAKALASNNNSFALEMFRNNPLVAIQHDGDLSKIEDNTKINSIVSHEEMVVNEKYKTPYSSRMNCFLFMATNRPVKISDAKSGIIRRLIDVSPSGKKVEFNRYLQLMSQIDFELGAIAYHCLKIYESMGKDFYNNYQPINMMYKTDMFFNFVEDNYFDFLKEDGVSLERAWRLYKEYCSEVEAPYKLSRNQFREELKNYFYEFKNRPIVNGERVRSYYSGFKKDIFEKSSDKKEDEKDLKKFSFDDFKFEDSDLDISCGDNVAQYANDKGTPKYKWENVKTTLKDLNTHEIHYLKLPKNHIVIDFDIKNDEGKKDKELNLKAIQSFPPTYGEFSQGGEGIHLHYIYEGDPDKLSNSFDDNIEIKTYKNPIRRRLSKCNNLPIATISSGLPIKEVKKMINFETVQTEKGIRTLIKKNLNKDIHPGTKPSVDFIFKILEDAYNSGVAYDVTDLRNSVLAFANGSTNHPDYCVGLVNKMHFKSEEDSKSINNYEDDKLIFFDVEVFPNLFLVNWKVDGDGDKCVRMINPKPSDIEELFKFKLVGFNNRRYDNHILYGCYLGYNNEQLYKLSQRIINNERNALFGEAYNISYTDIYDFASAANKKSLKKFEIELGIHHKELGFPWDEPVPEDKWVKVAEYCDNDVLATEAVFHYLKGDWAARQILADLTGKTVNDTTNQLSTALIFGKNRKPQDSFKYRNLSKPVDSIDPNMMDFLKEAKPDMVSNLFVPYNDAIPSVLPYFPGYEFDHGKSTYQDEEVGEGGYVYSEPGIYYNVALLDVESMHPNSAIDEMLFGKEYTSTFKSLLDARVSIKHENWESLKNILGGKLYKYVDKIKDGELSSKDLSNALKTVINSVYGLTSASFDNPFRDVRNKDNIVAKRGALFMIDLKHAVEAQGFKVAHIKTDSIKIPNATKDIIDFVMSFGKKYGYNFEHEATYEKMCLVNDAVYVAKYYNGKWTSTGTQFIHPYVFKFLFSKEPIEFEDMCETKSVKSSIYIDMNEDLPEGEHNYIFVGKVGSFCPMKKGHGGGQLVREQKGKYYAVTGTKGFLWQEAEVVKNLNKEQYIDERYFEKLCNDAIENISKYGSFEQFVNEPYEVLPWEYKGE